MSTLSSETIVLQYISDTNPTPRMNTISAFLFGRLSPFLRDFHRPRLVSSLQHHIRQQPTFGNLGRIPTSDRDLGHKGQRASMAMLTEGQRSKALRVMSLGLGRTY